MAATTLSLTVFSFIAGPTCEAIGFRNCLGSDAFSPIVPCALKLSAFVRWSRCTCECPRACRDAGRSRRLDQHRARRAHHRFSSQGTTRTAQPSEACQRPHCFLDTRPSRVHAVCSRR
eukprot:4472777-Prymnesium_polylepis.1